ncbi:hypothetical protein FOA52_009059 [Chlamydomonas sp. UWO 241]|nr:hypothetical protein FOA52_009059 [Chlamydomonas sp. UWO 241]
MPLLRRQPHVTCPNPKDLTNDERVWSMQLTGEVFRDYELYTKQLAAYRAKQWQCMYTGKKDLTYEQALEEERRSTEGLKEFPPELEAPCIKLVHHSMQTLDQLINTLYDAHGKAPVDGKENDDSTAGGGGDTGQAKRGKAGLVRRAVLRRWVLEVAVCEDRLWVARPAYASKHGLPGTDALPEAAAKQWAEYKAKTQHGSKTPGSGAKAGGADGKGEAGVLASPVNPGTLPGKEGEAKTPRPAGPKVLLSLEEEEARLKEGTPKYCAFFVLKAIGTTTGLTVEEIAKSAIERGLKMLAAAKPATGAAAPAAEDAGANADADKDASEKAKAEERNFLASMRNALRTSDVFALVAAFPHRYALAALPGVVAVPDVERKRPAAGAGGADGAAAAGTDGGASGSGGGAGALGDKKPAAVDPVVRAEKKLAQCASTHERYVAQVSRLEKQLADARTKLSDISAPPSPAAGVKASLAPFSPSLGSPPAFELPAELKEYSGKKDDRKALMKFKLEHDKAQKALVERKAVWIKEQRKSKHAASTAVRDAEAAVTNFTAELERARAAAAQAAATRDEAQRGLDIARTRVDAKEAKEHGKADKDVQAQRLKEQKDAHNVTMQMERERRRADPLLTAKFPIDDGRLYELLRAKAETDGAPLPAVDVFTVGGLHGDEGSVLADLLYAADFLQTFSKQLGLPSKSCVGYAELDAAITATSGAERSEAGDDAKGPTSAALLAAVYQRLLGAMLDDETITGGGRRVSRWASALSPTTWPEVARRYLLSLEDRGADAAAALLASTEVEGLGRREHAALLRALIDEAMVSGMVRDVLSARQEESAEVWTARRSEMVEERKKIKEIDEEVREVKKRKREEELQAQQERAVASAAAAAAAAGGDADGAAKAAAEQLAAASKSKKAKQGAAAAADDKAGDGDAVEEEPSFEVPEEWREWKGTGDRKAQMEWRQKANKVKADLDKAKARWEAGKRAHDKAAEALARAAADEEKKREKERKKAEDALAASQEALETELDKLAVRRTPLGSDRLGRRYWWGLAGHKGGLLVETLEGGDGGSSSFALMGSEEQIESLIASLDARGVRESELKRALTKALPTMASVFKKAREPAGGGGGASHKAEKHLKGLPAERVQPSRRGKPADLKEATAAAAAKKKGTDDEEMPDLSSPRAAALTAAADKMDEVAAAAGAAKLNRPKLGVSWDLTAADDEMDETAAGASKVPGAAGGWRGWRERLSALAAGELGDAELEAAADPEAALLSAMADRLLELEGLVAAGTGDTDALARAAERAAKEEAEGGGGGAGKGKRKPGRPAKSGAAAAAKSGAAGGTGGGGGDAMEVDAGEGGGSEEAREEEEEEDAMDVDGAGEETKNGKRRGSHARAPDGSSEAAPDADEAVDSESDEAEVPSRAGATLMWRSRRERASWHACVATACTAPRLAYCAAVLAGLAGEPLAALAKAAKGGRK